MSFIRPRKVRNILFLGTGGGNDVFSCLLAAATLARYGWEWDVAELAGVLSPFHKYEEVLGCSTFDALLINGRSRRKLNRRGEERGITFIDARVAALVEETKPYNIRSVYGLPADGSEGLKWSLHHMSGVDLIVLVDIGGDIFASWEDTHVLSPMFDAMALRGALESGKPCLLFEAGPGTDGEIDPERLRAELLRPDVACHPLAAEDVDAWETQYKKWIEPVRTGNTVPTTIRAFRERAPVFEKTYRARAQLGGRRWYGEFRQRIDADLCKRFYLMDPAPLLERNPFAIRCGNPEYWFRQTQNSSAKARNNEANMQYFMRHGRLLQFLTPSPLIDERSRREAMTIALGELEAQVCEEALVWNDDARWIATRWPGRFDMKEEDGLTMVRPR